MNGSAKQRAFRIIFLPLSLFLCLCWWWMSWDLSDQFVAGKYFARSREERSVLVLHHDHSFTQEVLRGGKVTQHAIGTWRRSGEGGIVFSDTFLGATMPSPPEKEFYGTIDNTFGFWTLTLNSQYNDSTKFHKIWFL